MEHTDLLVVGAGISGLSLAHAAARLGLSVRVLEATDRVGGCVHSHRYGGAQGDFWIELGSHTAYNSYGGMIALAEDLGLASQMIPRVKQPFKMWVDGAFKSIPGYLGLGAIRFAMGLPRMLKGDKTGKSVRGHFRPAVGARNYDRVFHPAFSAVACQDADGFAADMLFKKRPRRRDLPRSYSFTGGLSTLTDAAAADPAISVHPGMPVNGITFESGNYAVSTAPGDMFSARFLALAMPPDVAAGLLRPREASLADLLATIPMVELDSLGVVVEAAPRAPFAGLIPSAAPFFSAVSRDTVPHEHFRGFTFHFHPDRLIWEERLVQAAAVLGVGPEAFLETVEKRNRLPSLKAGHADKIVALDRHLAGSSLLLTGNYFNGLALEDCVSRSLAEADRLRQML
ncbi:MAG: protoporphyrinogen/coproporphyrinogen oxidase [Magnetospiraceae bacterium]